ncbi:Endonuclease/exonuclease/phosphatase [Ephemerocybe angulata]|uniref:Endonuclease/exonuclease/phosphatase n=1 Tax=Ephemerocybe angulata TaxID=980116 RepID=A0A8H6IKN8_9AGAR|nr:Endonuclease/exonuclease/phosphatase [Tulosesus angulatus]
MSDWELPEHISIIEKRKAKKLLLAQQQNVKPVTQLLERPWVSIPEESRDTPANGFSTKIMTWNLLAQCLVRRELFPTSDCLKAAQRGHLIHEEIERQNADILCLQEVDRLEKLCPMLEKAGYAHRFACGPFKKHGCLIAYKSSMYSYAGDMTVFYDDQEVGSEGPDSQRIGKSFRTKNIGFIVALQRLDDPSKGIVVATTHLFWHPRYTYERTRQAGCLVREATAFKMADPSRHTWPTILAGDFNFAPLDPAYSLLTASTLLPDHETLLRPSYVVHTSVDPTVAASPAQVAADAEEGGEEQDPDRVIKNARSTKPEDGLLDPASLVSFFSDLPRARSVYDLGLSRYFSIEKGRDVPIFGPGHSMDPSQPGFHEPAYTSYTHYWKSVLDYIFVLTSDTLTVQVTGILSPLPGDKLEPGLPQKKICGSDHLPMVAEINFEMS